MPALRRAADDGYAPAQSLYGYILDKAEYNEEAAQYFIRRAADQGDADGQYGLAMLYAAAKAWGAMPPRRATGSSAGNQGHKLAVVALSQAFLAGSLGQGRPGRRRGPRLGAQGGRLRLDSGALLSREGYRSGAFGAADPAQAERMEARIVELADNYRRKGKKK